MLQKLPGEGVDGKGIQHLDGLAAAVAEHFLEAGDRLLRVPVDKQRRPAQGNVLLKLDGEGLYQFRVRGEHGDVAAAAQADGGGDADAAAGNDDDGTAVEVVPQPGVVIYLHLAGGIHGQPELHGLRIAVDEVHGWHDLVEGDALVHQLQQV